MIKDAKDYVKPIALKFSEENLISESDEWANLTPEDGIAGNTTYRKGKTLEELYGKEKAVEIKLKQSVPCSDETKKKISKTLKENPVSYWLNETRSEETKKKISDGNRNKKVSSESREKISQATKGIPKQKIMCPYCEIIGGEPQMKRWHFDNCKLKKEHE